MSRFPIPSFSHSGEDRLLLKLMGERGFYVDVGCYHPVDFSNTYLLYLAGWRGVAIDADDTHLPAYKASRPGDVVVHTAIGEKPGERTLHLFDDRSLNTFDAIVAAEYRLRGYEMSGTARVRVDRLDAVLRRHGVSRVDLLNVDVEGADLEALRSNDWAAFRPTVVAVEDHDIRLDDPQGSRTFQYLGRMGYSLHSKVNYTSIYVSGDA